MIIVIDGYNLIGSEGGLRGDMEAKRNKLISGLKEYKRIRGYDVIVVFDGHKGESQYQTEEKTGGISVIYSRVGETADEVIAEISGREGNRCVVVSSDRMVISSALSNDSVPVRVKEFIGKMNRAINMALMQSDDMPEYFDEENEYDRQDRKKGNPNKLSKIERIRQRILAKL